MHPYTYLRIYIYTQTHTHTNHTGAHIVPAENRAFFRARPRFLADFIPIPRNKLADDHGGICLPGNLSSSPSPPPPPALRPLICCTTASNRVFFLLSFSSSSGDATPLVRVSNPEARPCRAREKGGVAPVSPLVSRFRPRLPRGCSLLFLAFSSLFRVRGGPCGPRSRTHRATRRICRRV